MTYATHNDGALKMAAREQFAWVWLSAMIVTYVPYFAAVALLRSRGEIATLTELGLFGAAVLAQGIILGIGHLIANSRRGAGARTKPDERDRAITHRANSAAYYVLMGGMIVVGCILPFSASGWDVFHAAVLAIVIAEIVNIALVVRAYRSGWQA